MVSNSLSLTEPYPTYPLGQSRTPLRLQLPREVCADHIDSHWCNV